MSRHICIHGHFYQPPRENPWLEEVELQDSAYPYHDWNERITRECYAPNAASRILDGENRITDIVNSYKRISFNFGPTLLTWMERRAPETYRAVIRADHDARGKFSGHGSAIAQCYNHMIMPLANIRDKRTQVLWGLKDFESRFGRKPEGMWLPETAVDLTTLDILAGEGVKFTILAPRQCRAVRKIGRGQWHEIRDGVVDPRRAYQCWLPSGRKIAVFFYDGAVAHDVSFGSLLRSGEDLARRFLDCFSRHRSPERESELVHIATDGETYGHHHGMGDMALAYCLNMIDQNDLADLTVYGEFLEKYPPRHEVQIIENSSWSCAHGVERWKENCGCRIDTRRDWTQAWRKPLRESLDWLRDRLTEIFEKETEVIFQDPWRARDHYIEVILDRSPDTVERFWTCECGRSLSEPENIKALKLLEMQRHAMLMYTSCGWFFDELSRIETVQILRYAARSIQLAKQVCGIDLEKEFLDRLATAPSNVAELKNGAGVYEKHVRPSVLTFNRVGAHYAMSSLFENRPEEIEMYSYTARSERPERMDVGNTRLLTGILRIRSGITMEEECLSFAVMHFGDSSLLAGVHEVVDEKHFVRFSSEIKTALRRSDLAAAAQLIEEHFGANRYSLKDLLRDSQSRLLYIILDANLANIERSLREINEHRAPVTRVLKELNVPLPKLLADTVSLMFDKDLLDALSGDVSDLNRLGKIIEEAKDFAFEFDRETLSFVARQKVDALMDRISNNGADPALLERTTAFLKALEPLSLQFDLWKAQNLYFAVREGLYGKMRSRAESADESARLWVEQFRRLGECLKVRVE